MAATLFRHAKGVLSYYKTGLTSGKMEGINRKIRGLLASAFGSRNYDFLKLIHAAAFYLLCPFPGFGVYCTSFEYSLSSPARLIAVTQKKYSVP